MLDEISQEWAKLSNQVKVFLITNNSENEEIQSFVQRKSDFEVHVVQPNYIGHPYLLTWIHREIFLKELRDNEQTDHFLYLEDDMRFTLENFYYFTEGIDALKPYRLLPGFLRFEVGPRGERFAVDVLRTDAVLGLPRVEVSGNSWWVNLRFPYQGMYLLDRENFEQFASSESFGPDVGHWGIRERATQGLAFEDVPRGCFSRYFVGYSQSRGIDRRAWVEHVSGRYTVDASSRFGKIPVEKVLEHRKPSAIETMRSIRSVVRLSRDEIIPRPVIKTGITL